MPRSSTSSRSSVPTPYHLRTPPARQLGVSITTVVMRGHRLRVRLPTSSQYAIPTSSPIQTEPESSPLPRLSGRHGLRRTRTVLESEQRSDSPRNHSHIEPMTATELTPSRNTVTTEGDDNELQSSVVDLDTTPIAGLELGQGLFNPVDPIAMGIPVFGVPPPFKDVMWLRTQLDSSDDGITPSQFRDMFGQCEGCDRFMMVRSKDQHECPGRKALAQLVSDDDELFCLLNVTAGGQGLAPHQFRYLFASCFSCKRMFTRMTASRHIHLDSEE